MKPWSSSFRDGLIALSAASVLAVAVFLFGRPAPEPDTAPSPSVTSTPPTYSATVEPQATPSPQPVPAVRRTQTPLPANPPASQTPAPSGGNDAAVLSAINAERTGAGAGTLAVNAKLTQAARVHASDMAARSYLDHTSPEGTTFVVRVNSAGYSYSGIAENIGLATDADDIVPNWMSSPPHRANILNASYREVGIATATGTWQGMEVVFAVAVFGSP